jgi:hypothetical protein
MFPTRPLTDSIPFVLELFPQVDQPAKFRILSQSGTILFPELFHCDEEFDWTHIDGGAVPGNDEDIIQNLFPAVWLGIWRRRLGGGRGLADDGKEADHEALWSLLWKGLEWEENGL